MKVLLIKLLPAFKYTILYTQKSWELIPP